MNQKLGKHYKLCSKKLIQQVFDEGYSLSIFPFSSRHLLNVNESPLSFQVAFSVPKKKFKSAVQRNRIRRRMREALRKNKSIIEDKIPADKQLVLFLIYSSHDESTFETLNTKMIQLLNKISAKL